jgi:hypothetical protein
MAAFPGGRPRRPRSRLLSVESLEDRCLLSSSSLAPAAVVPLPATQDPATALRVVQGGGLTADQSFAPAASADNLDFSVSLDAAANRSLLALPDQLGPAVGGARSLDGYSVLDGPFVLNGPLPVGTGTASDGTVTAPDPGSLAFGNARSPFSSAGLLDHTGSLLRPGEFASGLGGLWGGRSLFGGLNEPWSDSRSLAVSAPRVTEVLVGGPGFEEEFLRFDPAPPSQPATADRPPSLSPGTDHAMPDPWSRAGVGGGVLHPIFSDRYAFAPERFLFGNDPPAGTGNGSGGSPTPTGHPPGVSAPDPSGGTPFLFVGLAAESTSSSPAAFAGLGAAVAVSLVEVRRAGASVAREMVRVGVSAPSSLQAATGVGVVTALNPALAAAAANDRDGPGTAGFVPRGATAADARARSVLLLHAAGTPIERTALDQEAPAAPVLAAPQEVAALDLPSQAAAVLESGLSVDVAALGRDVDEFFTRLAVLGGARGAVQGGVRFLPWVVVLAGAAFEFARRWERKAARRPAADERLPGPVVFLPEEES